MQLNSIFPRVSGRIVSVKLVWIRGNPGIKELQPSAPDAVITEGSLLNRGTKKEISEWVKFL